jgi:hypothetical protein
MRSQIEESTEEFARKIDVATHSNQSVIKGYLHWDYFKRQEDSNIYYNKNINIEKIARATEAPIFLASAVVLS